MKIHRPNLLKHTFNVANRVRQTVSVAGLSAIRVAKGERPDAMLLKETFEQLGTTYIKIGQFIASTPSLFPREYVTAFQSCLDQTTPLSYVYIEQVLKEELAIDGKRRNGSQEDISRASSSSRSRPARPHLRRPWVPRWRCRREHDGVREGLQRLHRRSAWQHHPGRDYGLRGPLVHLHHEDPACC